METHNTFRDKYPLMAYSYVSLRVPTRILTTKLVNIKIEKYARFLKELSAPLFQLLFSNLIS